MTISARSIARSRRFHRQRAMRWILPPSRGAAPPGAAEAKAVQFPAGSLCRHLERGVRHASRHLQLGLQRPLHRGGHAVSSAGGGKVSGTVSRGRRRRGQHLGRRFACERQRPAGRQVGSRPLERRSFPATAAAAPGRRRGPDGSRPAKSPARRQRPTAAYAGRRVGTSSIQRGARTITTWRPSKRASCSTLANSATSLLTLSRSLVPISWCAISRPR